MNLLSPTLIPQFTSHFSSLQETAVYSYIQNAFCSIHGQPHKPGTRPTELFYRAVRLKVVFALGALLLPITANSITGVCSIDIQVEISLPLRVKGSTFSTNWLHFSLITNSVTDRGTRKQSIYWRPVNTWSTLRMAKSVLTFFGGQSLESTLQKPVCSLSLALLQEEGGVFQPHRFLLTETLQHCVVQFFCLLEGQSCIRSHRFIIKPCSFKTLTRGPGISKHL